MAGACPRAWSAPTRRWTSPCSRGPPPACRGRLVDAQGRVVGITTAIIPYARGVGFAVPVSTALAALARFQEMRSSVQARDGVRLGIGGGAGRAGRAGGGGG